MNSRMEKYSNSKTILEKRTAKNEELYDRMKDQEIDNFDVNSNVAVLGENKRNIDVEQIRQMLDKKYYEMPKRRSINIDDLAEEKNDPLEETKEYNINSIIKKARANQVVDYEKERLKKLRDTQYNILKNLNLEYGNSSEESKIINDDEEESNDEKLMTLIQTITNKEHIRKEKEEQDLNPLDILTDLKGSENTKVLDPLVEEIKQEIKEETKNMQQQEIKEVVKEEVQKEIEKTMFTNSIQFTKSDFDDFNDLKEDVKSSKTLIKILIGLIILALVFGVVVLINTIFNLS